MRHTLHNNREFLNMSHNQINAPASFPITLQQVKEWTRIKDNISDAELSGLIQAATGSAESLMNRPIINRSYTQTMDFLPSVIELLQVKVQSVTSITYLDTDGNQQTLAADQYRIDFGSLYKKATIEPAHSITWPNTRNVSGSIIITYVAGFGVDLNSVPADVQQAIAYLVGHYYDTRDIVGENAMIPETAHDILLRHRAYALS